MLKINLKPKAEDDLENIFNYGVNNFGFTQAREYIYKLDQAFELLGFNS